LRFDAITAAISFMKTLNKFSIMLLGILAFAAFATPVDGASAETNNSTLPSKISNVTNSTIVAKLDHIRLAQVSFERLSLEKVLRQLAEMAKQNDSEKIGINFLTATNAVSGQSSDINSIVVNLHLLTDVRLADVLDAIVLTADKPIKYSILDDGIVFAEKNQADNFHLVSAFVTV
jgi:hypothetical protein